MREKQWLKTHLSSTFDKIQSKETGLYLVAREGSLHLCTGVMLAFFHSPETTPRNKDMLKRQHKLGDIAAAVYFRSLIGMPSGA